MAPVQELAVRMNGLLVGRLVQKSNGAISFSYDPQWLSQVGARPLSLSLPLINQSFEGEKAYNFFDNLLPDSPLIRARLQKRFRTMSTRPFDLLSAIGRDCIGAIELLEDPEKSIWEKKIEGQALNSKAMNQLLKGYHSSPLGMGEDHPDFRISIAGAQEKTALLWHQKKWCLPKNTTPTTHIFKLPIGKIEHQNLDLSESCENEYLCLKIIQAFGLPTVNARILEFGDSKALVVERFDRAFSGDQQWIMRLPQEDLCQALGVSPNLKYESEGGPGIKDIMGFLEKSKEPEKDQEIFLKSQILFYLLAAIDGHAKNFSIFIGPSGAYSLAPIYDVLSAYPLIHNHSLSQQKIKMAMGLLGKNKQYHWDKIQTRHFLSTATAVNFKQDRMQALIQEILDQVEPVISKVSSSLPESFPTTISKTVFSGIQEAARRLSARTNT